MDNYWAGYIGGSITALWLLCVVGIIKHWYSEHEDKKTVKSLMQKGE